jgi:large repetitive protein
MAKFFKRNQTRPEAAPGSLQVKFEAVEPRVLFSATAVDPVDESVSAHHDLPQVQEEAPVLTSATPDLSPSEEVATPASSEDQIIASLNHHAADLDANESRQIVFISAGVFDPDYVANQLDPAYEIYLIEPGTDAIQQIAEALEGRSDISAIHLIGHGEEGRLFLGDTVLDADSMEGAHRAWLESIGQSLSANADILIYGCDFTSGEEGLAAASLLSAITGADVAASTDKTGNAELGGDWELETEIGLIEAQSLSLEAWRGVLAATDLSAGSSSLSVFDGAGIPVAVGTTVGTGGRGVWANAGTVGGQPIDLVATVISAGPSDTVLFENPLTGTDDPSFVLNGGGGGQAGEAIIEWSIVLAGTSIAATGDITFTIADIDGIGGNPGTRESVIPSLNGLTAFGANSPTNIDFAISSGSLTASGTQNQNTGGGQAEPEAAALFTWQNVSSWEITYQLAANAVTGQARFAHDGDGDFVFSNLQTTQLLGVDLDGNNSTATGADYLTRFNEGGAPVRISDLDTVITQNLALGTDLGEATVVLTNAQAGDELLVGGSAAASGTISGVSYTITNAAGQITIDFVGVAPVGTYESILESITFRNNTAGPSAVDRILEVTVFNTTYGTTSNTAISTIEVNRAPVANPASTNTGFQTAVNVNLTGNDTDPDGDAISLVGTPTVANPAHGTLSFVGGNWVFTPASTFSGTAVINYMIQDIYGATSTSTHNVVVANAIPVLVDNDPTPGTPFVNPLNPANLIVPAVDDVPFAIDLDAYFTDGNGELLTISPNLVGLPAWLSYNPVTNVFSGTPPVDNVGPVNIPVTVTDGSGGTFNGTITINPVNPGPTANPDSTNTGFQTPVIVDLLDNDTDPDGDPLSIVGTPTVANPAHGTIALVGGNWVFTPASTFGGTAVINYTIQDQDGLTSSSTHTVVVANAIPVLVDNDLTPGTPFVNPLNPANLIVPAVDNVPVAIDLDAYFADGNGDPLTIAPNLAGLPAWLSYNPATNVFSGTPPVDNVGPVNIPVTVTDGNGGTFNGTITINPVNPGPTANPDSTSTGFQTPVIVDVLGNDNDPDGDPLTIVGTPTLVNPAHGTLALVGGNWVFTPATTFSGTAVINYTIQDQDGATSSSTHNVVVANAVPVLVDIDLTPGTPYVNPLNPANLIVPAVDDVPLSIDLDAYFVDGNGELLTITPNLAGLPAWLSYNPATNVFSGTPPVDNAGPVNIPVTVTDGNGGTFNGTITINPVNPGPTANPDSTNTGFQTPVIVDLLANDTDPDGDPLTVVGTPTVANPAHGTIALVGGNWVFTPSSTFSGTAVINYTIQDQDGSTSSSTHNVVVSNVPPALVDTDLTPGTPSIDPLDPNNLLVPAVDNVPLTLDLDTYIVDPNGDTLTFTPNLSGLPAWLSYNPVTHVFTGTPPVDNAGVSVVIPVTVTDGNGGTFIGSITICPVNPGPIANPDSTNTVFQTPVIVDLLGNDTDPDGDPLTVVGTPVVANPAHGTIALVGGNWVFTPSSTFGGTAVINYTIQDQDGATSTSTHDVVVANDVPVLVDNVLTPGTPSIDPLDPANLIVPGEDNVPLSVDLDDYFEDGNLDVLSIVPDMSGVPAWLTFNPATGILSGTPPIANSGPITIPVTVTDGNGGTFTGTITVDPVNPAPVAEDDAYELLNTTPVVNVGNALDNDSDVDGDAIEAVVESDVPGSAGGLFSIDANGEVTFDPNGEFDDLPGGTSRETSFTYTLIDADGNSTTATVTVTVRAANEPPVPDSGAISVSVGTSGGNLGLEAPRDPDGDPLTITVTKLPRVGVLRLPNGRAIELGEVLTARQLEKLVYDAPATYSGTKPVRFRYSVSDGEYAVNAKVDIAIVQSTAITCYDYTYYQYQEQHGKSKSKK